MDKSNSPVKAATAVAALLDRAMDASDLRSTTAQVARKAPDLALLSASTFIFRLGAEWLGLATSLIDEVVERRPLHSLPHRREGVVRGLVNVTGQLTICIALEPLFQLEAAKPVRGHAGPLGRRLVVIASQGQRLAFEVDEVHGSHRYDPKAVKQVPSTVAHSISTFTTGVLAWGDHRVGLLDGELVVHAINRRLG
ncbi:chemotaxis protein CheW [Lysobacter tyrosinilyticus]